MNIGEHTPDSMRASFKKTFVGRYLFTRKMLLVALVVASIAGLLVASKKLQTKGYTGVWDFMKTVTTNYWHGLDAKPEQISIEIGNKDMKLLEQKREQALERGLIINDLDGDYVPATLEYKNKKIKIKLRLKGHMTDHLQDNKWSFRIKTKDNDTFLGMKRFSIQHPGTRGYIYEWVYHELMKREDIIALRYKFINVQVNGKDWGIYAVEENFEEELIENNNRKKGPILRFNPDLYWINRYNMFKRSASFDEFASYYSANPEAYREDKVLKDSVQRKYYMKAIALIEGVRNKSIPVETAFDIQRLAKFHAIIDLVGGIHSIDWSDIKYYYNPVTAKLEPVAYESFTDLATREISGQFKYVTLKDSSENFDDWHTALFSNPVFFEAYIAQLERVSATAYLDQFFAGVQQDLQNNLNIIYKEFPYKKFDKNGYYKNQKMIRQILATPKALQVYFYGCNGNQLQLQIGSIESLPVQISSVSIGDKKALPRATYLFPSKQRNQFVQYMNCIFDLPAGMSWNDSLVASLKVNYSVLGAKTICETTVYPFPHTDREFITEDLKDRESTLADFPFISVDDAAKALFITAGNYTINKDLIIPSGYHLIVSAGVTFDMVKNAKIVSYSALHFQGTEDAPIVVESSDSSAQGIELITSAISDFTQVQFKRLPRLEDHQWKRSGAITCYESEVAFRNCSFYNCAAKEAVNLIRSKFSFAQCFFKEAREGMVDVDYSQGTLSNCVFENCGENAIAATKSNLNMTDVYIHGSGDKAIFMGMGSELIANNIRIKQALVGICAENKTVLTINKLSITDAKWGVVAYKNKPGAGHPIVAISELVQTNVINGFLNEKKSSIKANGAVVADNADDVEKTIKREQKHK